MTVMRLTAEYGGGIVAGIGTGSMLMGAMAYWGYLHQDNGLIVALLFSPWLIVFGSYIARRAQAKRGRELEP
jgi:hypothetical protein